MRTAPILAVLAAIAAGCDMETWDLSQPAPTPNAVAEPTDQPVMATVNGEPIYMAELNEILVANYGMNIAQHLIFNKIVAQEALRRGVTASDDDVRAESDYVLDQITDDPDADPAKRRELLTRTLAREGLSYSDYQKFLRRQALLRKMAAEDVRIYEADVRKEFDRQYGRQVVVRNIQVASAAAAEQILQMARDGADFARLAQENSLAPSARDGGLVAPIGPMSTEWPPAIRDVALSLREVGELSDIIRTGTVYHVLRLERNIPPRDATFDEVKDDLRVNLRRRVIQEDAMPRLLSRLSADAHLEFVDPILQRQYARRDMQP